MPFTPPIVGNNVLYHQRGGHGSAEIDAPATVTAVLQPGGSQVKLTGTGFASDFVDHISFAGDPAAAAAYWTYGDDRDGDSGGGLGDLGGLG
jgi:hypothetical protein